MALSDQDRANWAAALSQFYPTWDMAIFLLGNVAVLSSVEGALDDGARHFINLCAGLAIIIGGTGSAVTYSVLMWPTVFFPDNLGQERQPDQGIRCIIRSIAEHVESLLNLGLTLTVIACARFTISICPAQIFTLEFARSTWGIILILFAGLILLSVLAHLIGVAYIRLTDDRTSARRRRDSSAQDPSDREWAYGSKIRFRQVVLL
ncbi:hypothetical protein B0T17DRAFT_615677 [Bombardia bombarda]|uniref:Uncharacterized protein n=1 Tax=Bombardia bombarda TaxID=252184 RepID=A0AA39X9R9_9PEZI|nr:hypothetical protein B0T17DRAFT_615677 [Bombardia bombarda]